MKTSRESHGNLTRAIKGMLGLKWLRRKSQTLAPVCGDSCQPGFLARGQLCAGAAGEGEEPFASLSLQEDGCTKLKYIMVHSSSRQLVSTYSVSGTH